MGTACHVRGSPKVLERLQTKLGIQPGGTTRDRLFTLETVNCLGACALGPIVVADGEYAGQMTPQKADALLKNIGRHDHSQNSSANHANNANEEKEKISEDSRDSRIKAEAKQ